MRSKKNASQLREACDLRGRPNFVLTSQSLNWSDSSSMSQTFPDWRAGKALRSIALLSVVRWTPHVTASSATIFMLAAYYLLDDGAPCAKAYRAANRRLTAINLIANNVTIADREHCSAGLIRPGIIPGANRDNSTGLNFLIDLVDCHCRNSFSSSLYLILGTFLLYSTFVEKSRGFGMSFRSFQKFVETCEVAV